MSTTPGSIPIDFIFDDFESSMRLQTDAQTFAVAPTPIEASFKIEGTIELNLLKSTFFFSTDEINRVLQNQDFEEVNFVIDSRPWLTTSQPALSSFVASNDHLLLSDYTTATSSTTITAWLHWLMYKVTNIKDSIVLVKNANQVRTNMDNIYENFIWKQSLYYKLWAQDLFKPSFYDSSNVAIVGATAETYAPVSAYASTNTKVRIDGVDTPVVAVDSTYTPISLLDANGIPLYKLVTNGGAIEFDPTNLSATWPGSSNLLYASYSPGVLVAADSVSNYIYIFDTSGNQLVSVPTSFKPVNNVFYSAQSSNKLHQLTNSPYSVMEFDNTRTDLPIGQKILETMAQKDLARFSTAGGLAGGLPPASILDADGNRIKNSSGVELNNYYSFPFIVDDTIQFKLNCMVPYNNIKNMFGNNATTLMENLNTNFNKAAVEHEDYISFLVILKVVDSTP